MGARAEETGKPELVQYGNAMVRLYTRGDGMIAVAWREGGRIRKTTRATIEDAREFARRKCRELDEATGQRWISPARHERLAWLEKLAGGEAASSAMLRAVEAAAATVGGWKRLEDAARYYTTQGPGAAASISLGDAVEAVVKEYIGGPHPTLLEMRTELRGFSKLHPDLPLLDVTREALEAHIRREGLAKRTVWNRIRRWNTFFNRCVSMGWWPEEKKNPTKAMKRPRLADTAPPVFTPEQGGKLLAAVAAEKREFLPFLIIAGWIGCRPSECLRLRRADFDFDHHMLHVRAEVAGKTSRERWVPMDPAASTLLQRLMEEETHGKLVKHGKVCRIKSREQIAIIAKRLGYGWQHDVLRHSYITYRLQIAENIDRVAEESGNSPAIIRSNYRRPIPAGRGAAWFALLQALLPARCQS